MKTEINKKTIEKNLDEIEDNIEEIKADINGLSKKEFLNKQDKVRSVKYLLIRVLHK